MKALTRSAYGGPEVLELADLERPVAGDDEVLLRVHAASLNRIDWYALTGTPWVGRVSMGLRKPKTSPMGADLAGTVEAVGKNVTRFQPGDEVFGRAEPLGEYVTADAAALAHKPGGVTFEEAATVSVAGRTALQALRDHAQVRPGDRVMVNGASGGVGTFAVQIAKALGADVTAVVSPANVEAARSLGADRVIDYTREDFTRTGERYDVLFDNAGSRSWRACKRVLAPEATVLLVGGPKKNRFLGPIGHLIAMKLAAKPGKRKAVFFIAKPGAADLEALAELLEAGTVRPVIDQRYPLSEIRAAYGYLGEGHAKGKVVITVHP